MAVRTPTTPVRPERPPVYRTPCAFPKADMEEWRQCGRWLIDCKVLPPSHRVVWPSAAVFDLAQALRDGVLLCQMLHNLSPGSVDLKEINFRPQMSQVKKERYMGYYNGVLHHIPMLLQKSDIEVGGLDGVDNVILSIASIALANETSRFDSGFSETDAL